jgi:hypothetical protein
MISDEVRATLEKVEIEGNLLKIPGTLDRKLYVDVNKVLANLGGSWNTKLKAHVFPGDPREALAQVLESGNAPRAPKTVDGFVATPYELAYEICRNDAGIDDLEPTARVLEPSAGTGVFVKAMRELNLDVTIVAVEPNPDRAGRIPDGPRIFVESVELETFAATYPGVRSFRELFDSIVMNPPFAVPGNPTLWVDHVELAYGLLKPGGRLTAIVPAGFKFREDKKPRRIRELIETYGGWRSLPDNSFGESGTGVNTCLIWIERPDDESVEPEPEVKEEPTDGQSIIDSQMNLL